MPRAASPAPKLKHVAMLTMCFSTLFTNASMSSCGQGAIDVFDQTQGTLQRLARIVTSPGARTALFVPELDRLYVAARSWAGGAANF